MPDGSEESEAPGQFRSWHSPAANRCCQVRSNPGSLVERWWNGDLLVRQLLCHQNKVAGLVNAACITPLITWPVYPVSTESAEYRPGVTGTTRTPQSPEICRDSSGCWLLQPFDRLSPRYALLCPWHRARKNGHVRYQDTRPAMDFSNSAIVRATTSLPASASASRRCRKRPLRSGSRSASSRP